MRKTDLRRATTGVVVTTIIAIALLGVLRGIHSATPPGDEGAALFVDKGCSHCHYTDRKATKHGPGLKGLFKRESLPVSGRPVTEENIRRQLEEPYKDMPSFSDRLTEDEKDRLIDYLTHL